MILATDLLDVGPELPPGCGIGGSMARRQSSFPLVESRQCAVPCESQINVRSASNGTIAVTAVCGSLR